jgi:hypothetical protein
VSAQDSRSALLHIELDIDYNDSRPSLPLKPDTLETRGQCICKSVSV